VNEPHAVVCDELLVATNAEFEAALDSNGNTAAAVTASASSSTKIAAPSFPRAGSRSFHSIAIALQNNTSTSTSTTEADAAAVAAAWASHSESAGTASADGSKSGSDGSSKPLPPVEALVVRIERTTGDVFVSRVGNLEAAFSAFKACLLLFHTLNNNSLSSSSSGYGDYDSPLLQLVSRTVNAPATPAAETSELAAASSTMPAGDGDDTVMTISGEELK
jgi:hypothetical protein